MTECQGEANAIERRIQYLDFLREGGTPYHAGPCGEHQGGQEAEAGVRGTLRIGFLFFSGKSRKGRVNSSGLTSMSNSNGLWAKGVGSSCLECVLSHVRLFTASWTVAYQAPLSMKSSRQEYWSGLPFPTLQNLLDTGIEPESLESPALTGRFFTAVLPR